MKRICVVGIALHKEAQKILEKVYCVEGMDAVKEAEAALVYTVPDEWIEKAEKLRAVGCHSCSPAFVEWAEKKGIAVIKAQSLWRTVAEHTLALAMAAARWIPQADHAVRIGEWKDHETLKIQYPGWNFGNFWNVPIISAFWCPITLPQIRSLEKKLFPV